MKILVTMSMLLLFITGMTAQEYKPVKNTIQSNEVQGFTGGVYSPVHPSTPLRMTDAGLRMTVAGFNMTIMGF